MINKILQCRSADEILCTLSCCQNESLSTDKTSEAVWVGSEVLQRQSLSDEDPDDIFLFPSPQNPSGSFKDRQGFPGAPAVIPREFDFDITDDSFNVEDKKRSSLSTKVTDLHFKMTTNGLSRFSFRKTSTGKKEERAEQQPSSTKKRISSLFFGGSRKSSPTKKEEEEVEEEEKGKEQKSEGGELQSRISNLLLSRKKADAEAVRLSVSKRQSECQGPGADEGDEPHKAPTDALALRTAKIDLCKARMNEKMQVITKVAEGSPLAAIPADKAIRAVASKGTGAVMDVRDFLDLIMGMVSVKEQHIVDIFNSLDMDDTGFIDSDMWISFIPFFMGTSFETAKASFCEIDADKGGTVDMEEFERYVATTISLIVPPDDPDLRKKLLKHLTKTIFAEIDTDGNGTMDAEEFHEWSQSHSLQTKAMHCLEELIPAVQQAQEKDEKKGSKESVKRGSKESVSSSRRKSLQELVNSLR